MATVHGRALPLSARHPNELRCHNPECAAVLDVIAPVAGGGGGMPKEIFEFLGEVLANCADLDQTSGKSRSAPSDLLSAFHSLTVDPPGFAALLGSTLSDFGLVPTSPSTLPGGTSASPVSFSTEAAYTTSRVGLPLCDACMADTVRVAERLRDAAVEKRDAVAQYASKVMTAAPATKSEDGATAEGLRAAQQRAEEEELERAIAAEEKRLLADIRRLRRRKERLAMQRIRQDMVRSAIQGRLRASASTLRQDVSSLLSVTRDRMADLQDRDERARHRLSRIRYLSVHNDAFFIWHAGPLVTINGCRLGRNLIAPPTASSSSGGGGGGSSGGYAGGALVSGFGGAPSFPGSLQQQFSTTAVVDKSELNAALGQVALLLTTIANRLGYNFQRYRVIPMGSYSRIAPAEDTKAMLELHFTGKMFSQGRLNAALKAMMVCIAELGDYAQSLDRSFWWPYPITHGGEKIADLSVSVASSTLGSNAVRDAQWSRAMKCALTNLKWLLAWAFRQA